MRKSTLREHRLIKKTLTTPFNYHLSKMVTFKSWQLRFPSLIWIAIIIEQYGHINGLEKCYQIIDFMRRNSIIVNDLKITSILALTDIQKEILFDYINNICEEKILDCLCLVIDDRIFRKKFYKIENTSEIKIQKLQKVIRSCYSKYSYLGCDLRFFFAYHQAFIGKLKLVKDCFTSVNTFQEYYRLEHDDPKMEMYRSDIRSLELSFSMISEDNEYSIKFWEKIGFFSECDLYLIDYDKGDKDVMNEFYKDVINELHNLMANNYDKKNEEKFIVIMGLFTYAVKILKDVCNANLHNTVSSRILLRTIMDVFINIKYLLLLEKDNLNVWREFQDYGLGKYKLIYKKAEEKYQISENSHLTPKILEAIINDDFDEETMNIDLGYFDKTSIIKKFDEVGEKELYDTIYDYDVSYSHAYWGAVRESSMLKCDNVLHQLHISPDESCQQLSKSTHFDYISLFIRIMLVISTEYNGIDESFFKKYEVINNETYN